MARGELVGNRIVVWDIAESRRLFGEGYYGKPVGIPKPRVEEIDAPLVLDLIEGAYLLERGRISVYEGRGRVGSGRLGEVCRREHYDFDRKYAVYRDFRDKGYVVSPGIKFGCDFAVYERGPGIDHAPYLVRVCGRSEPLTSTGVVLAGRLATTVRKQFIFAIPGARGVEYLALDWWKA